MHKIKEMLMDELHEIEEKLKKAGGKISAGDVEYIHVLTDTIKNIAKIEILEEDGGYSEASNWMGEGRMYGNSYGDGNSYARGRRNARRDSMGRYSREGGYSEEGMSYEGGSSHRGGGSSYRDGGSNRGGYSRGEGKEHMIEKLEDMMDEAGSDKEREAIRHCISKLQNA